MTRTDRLLALFVPTIWGANFAVIRIGLHHVPPLRLAALRFLLVGFPLCLVVPRPAIRARLVLAIGAVLWVIKFGLLYVALDVGMPAGLASLVLQLQVLATIALAALVLHERPTRRELAGGAIALVGLALIAVERAAGASLLGLGLTVAAACAWGVANLLTRVARPPDPLALMVWSSLVAPLPLLALSLAFEAGSPLDTSALAPGALGSLAYTVVLASLLGFTGWSHLVARHPAATVAPYALLVPVAGIAVAAPALGERPGPRELAGAAVIVAGLAAMRLPLPG